MPGGTEAGQLDTAGASNEAPRIQTLAHFQHLVGQSPRVTQLVELTTLIQNRHGRSEPLKREAGNTQSASAGTGVLQRVGSMDDLDDELGDDEELSDEEQEYLPPPRATLWDYIEPVLTPAVARAQARAQALKEHAARAEAEAQAQRDAQDEALAREEAQRAAEEEARARAAAVAAAEAEALARQQADEEARRKADEALALASPEPTSTSNKTSKKKGLGPNRSAAVAAVPTAKKKKFSGKPMKLGVPDIGSKLGQQDITNHPAFVLNLFYTLNNHPPENQIHIHLGADGRVLYVSKKTTGQSDNGVRVPNNSQLFRDAADRAARDQ